LTVENKFEGTAQGAEEVTQTVIEAVGVAEIPTIKEYYTGVKTAVRPTFKKNSMNRRVTEDSITAAEIIDFIKSKKHISTVENKSKADDLRFVFGAISTMGFCTTATTPDFEGMPAPKYWRVSESKYSEVIKSGDAVSLSKLLDINIDDAKRVLYRSIAKKSGAFNLAIGDTVITDEAMVFAAKALDQPGVSYTFGVLSTKFKALSDAIKSVEFLSSFETTSDIDYATKPTVKEEPVAEKVSCASCEQILFVNRSVAKILDTVSILLGDNVPVDMYQPRMESLLVKIAEDLADFNRI